MDDRPLSKKRKIIFCAIVAIVVCVVALVEEETMPAFSRQKLNRIVSSFAEGNIFALSTDIDEERRFLSENIFWELFDNGRSEDWYKEYRMRKVTFKSVVHNCLPFLYPPNLDEERSEARKVYLKRRGTIKCATFIRYLATECDQHAIGKEFGIRQPAVSRRIRQIVSAMIKAYHDPATCENPIIRFADETERRESMSSFLDLTNGIPYLIEIIDGTIVLNEKPPAIFFVSCTNGRYRRAARV